MKKLLTGFFIGLLIPLTLTAHAQPSFDCSKALTPVERVICGDREVSKLDRDLSRIYATQLAQLTGAERQSLIQGQKKWLYYRDTDCNPKSDLGGDGFAFKISPQRCLMVQYLTRISQIEPRSMRTLQAKDIVGGWIYYGNPAQLGDMQITQSPSGHFGFKIHTISGTDYSQCDLETAAAVLDRDQLTVSFEGTNFSASPPKPALCTVAIQFFPNRAVVGGSGEACSNFCGMIAGFGGNYLRVGK